MSTNVSCSPVWHQEGGEVGKDTVVLCGSDSDLMLCES